MNPRDYTLLTIDAFTDEPFKGNPAAVCVIPDGEKYRSSMAYPRAARE